MAFRFRKSVKVAPGVRVNIGKKSASVTLGGRGARVTTGTAGTTASASVPGTGIGYSSRLSTGSAARRATASPDDTNGGDTFASFGIVASICGICFPPILLVSVPAIFLGKFYSRSITKERAHALETHDAAIDLSKRLDRVNKSKTLTTRLKNCTEALHLLERINQLDPRGKVIENQKHLRRLLETMQRVLPVVDSVDKAELKYMEGNYTAATKHAQKAVALVDDKSVTDKDLKLCEAKNVKGKPLTIKLINRFLADIHKRT